MEQYWRGRGWGLNETAIVAQSICTTENKANKTKLSLAVSASCSIFSYSMKLKHSLYQPPAPRLPFSFYPTAMFTELRGAPLLRRKGSRVHGGNKRCTKCTTAQVASAAPFRLPVPESRSFAGKISKNSLLFPS